jgi:hypothetical protein
MADIEHSTPDDRRGLEQLYRRALGNEAADRFRLQWDWARRNPAFAARRTTVEAGRAADAARDGIEPDFWVVREGPTIIAASSLTPVAATLRGSDVAATWSSDPLVVAERQRQGLGSMLLRAWDRDAGVALGARLSSSTRIRLDEMRWPRAVPLPCLVKPLSRRALRRPDWPTAANRFVSALTLPFVRVVGRNRPIAEGVEVVRRFDSGVDGLWARVAPRLDLAVARHARYLNWKFVEPPHVRYAIALLRRGADVHGYMVYRHLREPHGRVTQIVDLLTDPSHERGLKTLIGWVDREARMEDSDKVRCFTTHGAFRRVFRRSGYFVVKSGIDLTVKVNAVEVPRTFYTHTDAWHFTLGDDDLDH